MRLCGVVSVACLGALALPSTAGAAALTATPGIAARGATVTLTGSGFTRRVSGVVGLSGHPSVRFRVDGRGRAVVVMRILGISRLGGHRLVMQAGRRRVSTLLTVVAARRAPSRLAALSGRGQRVLLRPAHASAGEPFTLKVTGLRGGAKAQAHVAGIAVAKRRANARGALSIVAQIPALAPARYLVDLTSDRMRIGLRLVVLAPPAPTPPPPGAVRIAAAGDIACAAGSSVTSGSCHQKATSDLLVSGNYDAVLALGDVQYHCGSFAALSQVYGPTWGRVLSRTHPVIGNHEYLTSGDSDCTPANAGGAGYFDYFGARAGNRGEAYYSYDVGSWHLIALNSSCGAAGGCDPSTPQGRWLAQDLAAHRDRCSLAYWHIPLFSSGGRAARNTAGFWEQLYNAGADIILSGHDHIYERFAPQDPTGGADPDNGIRQFVVGTGGANHTAIAAIAPNSEVRDSTTYGVLELTLADNSYDWRFRPESGATFTDSGSTTCHP